MLEPDPPKPLRSRFLYALLLLVTVVLGLASRRFSHLLPPWLAKNLGDALYAVLVFGLIGFLFPRLSTALCAVSALLFCFGIEFLKFAKNPWLVAARHSSAGALVFGRGFHMSNLVCYFIGTLAAAAVELAVEQTKLRRIQTIWEK